MPTCDSQKGRLTTHTVITRRSRHEATRNISDKLTWRMRLLGSAELLLIRLRESREWHELGCPLAQTLRQTRIDVGLWFCPMTPPSHHFACSRGECGRRW